MSFDDEESYFWDIQSKLERKLRGIKGVDLLFERAHQVEREWHDWDSDEEEEEDFPSDRDETRSYHLYFLSPEGKQFHCKTETEVYEEDERDFFGDFVPGDRDIGLAVGISLVAPIGIIVPTWRERFLNGDASDPDIHTHPAQSTDGEPVPYMDFFREFVSEEGFRSLTRLTAKIRTILESHGIRVLQEEEWNQPVPGLRPCEELAMGEPVTVTDAFFFRDIV
jgi:hypothetical protein